MTDEDRTPSQDIELSDTAKPPVRVVLVDEAALVLEEAEMTKLIMEPRRPYPRSTGK
ncbi:hypothetical protein ACWCPS_33370 [Streptomyces mauvecolor]